MTWPSLDTICNVETNCLKASRPSGNIFYVLKVLSGNISENQSCNIWQCDIVLGVGEVVTEAREVDILVECYGCGTPTNLCTFSDLHVPGFPMQHVDWIRCTCSMGTVPALRYVAEFDFLKKAMKRKGFPAVLVLSTFKAIEEEMLQDI